MEEKKGDGNSLNCNRLEQTKKDLLNDYSKHLDEIFAKGTYDMSFDERETMISGKLAKEIASVMEKHLEEDPQSVDNNNGPEEIILCPCGTIAILRKDEKGNPKIYKREIQTKDGPVNIKEYGYYCSKDRKIFFPSQKNT